MTPKGKAIAPARLDAADGRRRAPGSESLETDVRHAGGQPPVRDAVKPVTRRSAAELGANIIPAQAMRRQEPRSVFDRRDERPSQAPPVVRITIGKIEVRSTPQKSAPRPRPARTMPGLTLEQYLRRRSGGTS